MFPRIWTNVHCSWLNCWGCENDYHWVQLKRRFVVFKMNVLFKKYSRMRLKFCVLLERMKKVLVNFWLWVLGYSILPKIPIPHRRTASNTLDFCCRNLWSPRGSKFCRLLWKNIPIGPVLEVAFHRGVGFFWNVPYVIRTPCFLLRI